MKRLLNIAFFLTFFGCGASSEKSLLNDQVVVIESLDGTLFGDLFDAIPEGAKSQFVPFQYARPICANQSSCQISLPNGSSYSMDDLQSMINYFDGNIKITQYDYEVYPKSPEYSPCYSTNCWPSWGPGPSGGGGSVPGGSAGNTPGGNSPGGGSGGSISANNDYNYNPNYLNIGQMVEDDTRRRVKWAEDQLQNGKNTPQGMGDVPLSSIPDVTYDYPSAQSFQDNFNKQHQDLVNDLNAEAQRQQQESQNVLIAYVTILSQKFTAYQKIKNDYKSKTDELSQKAKENIAKADFQNAESKLKELSGIVERARNNRTGLASTVRQKIPATNSAPPVSQYKTEGFSVVGQAVRRADSYLGYVERSLGNYPVTNQGRIVADNLMKDSRIALEAADSSYAQGNNKTGDAGLRFAYALADTALALGPLALLTAGPVGVVAAIGVEALNIGKNWYEYRTGKSLWTGEPISQFQKDMAMANVVVGFIPAAASAGAGIVGLVKGASTSAKETLIVGRTAEESAEIGNSIAKTEQLSESAQKWGVTNADEMRTYTAQLEKYKGTVSPQNLPYWNGSGPASGVLGRNALSKSSEAIKNYFPPNGGIEYIFDRATGTFLVGKPNNFVSGLSPHENLVNAIQGDLNSKNIVGGFFSRGSQGEIILNQNTGHYWRNWSAEAERELIEALRLYGIEVKLEGFVP
jgi:hypothetical protein